MPRTIRDLPAIPFLIRAVLLIHAVVVLETGASSVVSAEPARPSGSVFNACELALNAESPVAARHLRLDTLSPSPMTRPLRAISTPAFPALPASVPSWSYQTNQPGAQLGYSLGVGDVTGDGVDDLSVGVSGFMNGEEEEGAVLLFPGSPAGLGATPLWTIESNLADTRLAIDSDIVRDVNGDGLNDLLVGARDFSNDQHEEGVAALWIGISSEEPPCRPSWVIEGNEEDGYFGYTVTGAGDVNGDGYGDVMVGWTTNEAGQYGPGRASVYLGGPLGLRNTPIWSVAGAPGSNEFLGYAAAAGDVNGDGYGDLLVGAIYHDNGQLDEGAAFLYQGSPAGLSSTPVWSAEANQVNTYFGVDVASGDVNGDGYSDMMIVAYEYDFDQNNDGAVFIYHGSPSGLPANPSLVLNGSEPGFSLGAGSTVATGDVNGDGFDDLLVGTSQFDNGQVNEGAVFLHLGSPAGLSSTPAWMAEGNQSASYFGSDLRLADLNDDGLDDVIVSAVGYSDPEIGEGAVFVYLTQGTVAPAAGRLPEEDPLTLRTLPGGAIELTWGASCLPGDSDYEIYEGVLGNFASHLPRTCSTGGLQTHQLMPSAGNRYYVVVPRNTLREGSYGRRSDGSERPSSASACLPQAIAASCPVSR